MRTNSVHKALLAVLLPILTIALGNGCRTCNSTSNEKDVNAARYSRPFPYLEALSSQQQEELKGLQAYVQGRYLQAIGKEHQRESRKKLQEALLCLSPEDTGLLFMEMIVSDFRHEKYDDAMELIQKMLEKYPERLAFHLVKFDIQELQNPKKWDPNVKKNFLLQWLNRKGIPQEDTMLCAEQLEKLKDYPHAADAYQTALRASPESEIAILGISRCLIKQQKPNDALLFLEKKVINWTPDLHIVKMGILQSQKKYDQAFETIAPLLRLTGDETPSLSAPLWEAMGQCCVLCGKKDYAIRCFRLAWEQDRDNPSLCNAYGYTLADYNVELELAEILITKALKNERMNPAYLDSLAWLRFRQKKFAQAMEIFKNLLKNPIMKDDPFGEMSWHAGAILYEAGEIQKAETYLNQAAKFDSVYGKAAREFLQQKRTAKPQKK